MKKSWGRLIYVSDFIEKDNGHLIVYNQEGAMVKDAHCIMYPGTSGDKWWDLDQLLMQVDRAIEIFEEAHPNCVMLFLFDHTLAHTLLRPEALHAFDMNKGNGRKRKQRDTVIPMNNPTVECHRKTQKMMTETGEAKGLQQMLEECGFNICGMCAKCSPVCPFKNNNCCIARLLSKQDNF